MGMLQIQMKKTPAGMSPLEYSSFVHQNVANLCSRGDEDTGTRPEGANVWLLKPEQFEEYWTQQENLKQTPEVKEKYKKLTEQGQVVAVEIDW